MNDDVVTPKQVAVIMVSYGDNSGCLRNAIESLYQNRGVGFHLFLICNAVQGYALEVCQQNRPNLTVIYNTENLFWVGAVNQGIRLSADYEYVAFMNDDIVLPDHCLAEMVNALQDRRIGVVGPLTSNNKEWQGYDNFRTAVAAPAQISLPDISGLGDRSANAVSRLLWQANVPDAMLGSGGMLAFFCVCFRRETIDNVGLLDKDFAELMCGDDDDYCHRILEAGYPLSAILLKVLVEHVGGASIMKTSVGDGRAANKRRAAELLADKLRGRSKPDQPGPH